MSDYPLIADHGLIGDLQTAALVATDGSIDWFCAPRFDSPSIFGALLDHDRGGHFRVRPTVDVFTSKQLYFPDTAVLVTRFMTEAGVGEVVDFMPVTSSTVATDQHRLVRMVRCVRGQMTFAVDIAPRFDYGREPHETHLSRGRRRLPGQSHHATVLNLVREPDDERLAQTTRGRAGRRARRGHAEGRPDARTGPGDGQRRPGSSVPGGGGPAALRRHGATSGRPGSPSRRTPGGGARR